MEWCPGHRFDHRRCVKKLFPGLTSAVVLRRPSRRQTFLRRPPSWIPSFEGVADARVPIVLYNSASGQFVKASYFGPLPDDVCFPIVENINATGTAANQGGTYFNRYVVQHLVTVELV